MPALCVPVESYSLRGARSEAMLPSVQLQLATPAITVAELIRRTLIEQLAELTVKRFLDAAMARDSIARQYLSAAEIAEQAAAGSVRGPAVVGKTPDVPQFDVEAEVRKAWRGFEKRTFRVVVDGRMPVSLEEALELREDSKVAFMRLTPLVGG